MVEKSSMSLLGVTVALLVAKFPVPNFDETKLKLQFDSAVGETHTRFKCAVCSCIAFPINKGCARCFTYACQPCMTASLKQNKECPNPKCAAKHPGKDYKQSEEMHPDDQEKYEEIQLKCTDCDTIFRINDTTMHKKECLRPKWTCECCHKEVFRTREAYE